MRKLIALIAAAICAVAACAQAAKGPFEFGFYGCIRADVFYNSRACHETVDGLFCLYPKDRDYDAMGNDINADAQGNFYVMCARLGLNVSGPRVGTAATSAKVEIDFRGSGSSFALARIRHAYVELAWTRHSLLVGQTWHPLFGEVSPSMLNMSTGAPFQPFNRSPQLRWRYLAPCGAQLTAAAVWQQQYCSAGPEGKSHEYLKNGCVPELFAGVDYKGGSWQAGIGAELLSIRPRKRSVVDGQAFKVDERATSLSVEAHAKYAGHGWRLAAKTALASNLTQCSMLGGYAVTAVDPATGKCQYAPFRHSMTWANAVWGAKWQPGVFVGYLKNLGTGRPIAGQQYGVGLDVDQLLSANAQLSYNLPHWKLGVEVAHSTAWYGKTDMANGRVTDTHAVCNWRFLGQMMYIF